MEDTGILKFVSTSPGECECNAVAKTAGQGGGGRAKGVCSSSGTVAKIADFVVDNGLPVPSNAPATEVVKKAAKILDCETEACVVRHKALASYVVEKHGKDEAVQLVKESRARLKTTGPRDSTDLLSNFNIDHVLRRWAVQYPKFYNCPFSMMDFEKVVYDFSLLNLADIYQGKIVQRIFSPDPEYNRKDLEAGKPVKRRSDCFACVLNTDVSSGKGKHWVCVFADMRQKANWTIEYFNSSGNPPPKAVTRWMETQANNLRERFQNWSQPPTVKTVVVTSVAHQKGDTECGLYTLYYIRARLEGHPASAFAEDKVPDSDMTEFRKHVFSSA